MTEKYTGIDTFNKAYIPYYLQAAKEGCVIAIDTETTGLHNHDDIVQLAWVVMEKGEIRSRDYTNVQNLSVPINGTEAQKINHLTDAFLMLDGRSPNEVFGSMFYGILDYYISRYGYVVLVGHNLQFDIRMLYHTITRYCKGADDIIALMRKGCLGCDTKEYVKALNLPKEVLPDNTLATCISAFALDAANTHQALNDTIACMELFRFLTTED